MMEAQAATMSRMSVAQHSFPMQASALPRVTPMIALKNVLTMIFASVFAKPNNVIALSYALANRIFFAFRTNSAIRRRSKCVCAPLDPHTLRPVVTSNCAPCCGHVAMFTLRPLKSRAFVWPHLSSKRVHAPRSEHDLCVARYRSHRSETGPITRPQ